MLPMVTEFVRKYDLSDYIVVADSGLMNNGYKYIIGTETKTESLIIKNWTLSQSREGCRMAEYDKGDGKRLLADYTADRARKDAYNREKGIRRLAKAYRHGTLTKENINKCGYNKFLTMQGNEKVSIDYDKLEADVRWNGLKGYLTNTGIPATQVYAAYHNLGQRG